MNLSVIICTHNPRADYLRRTLDSLKAQTLPQTEWDFLLVDNGSREPLAGSLDLGWHGAARIIREEKLGLTVARLAGIRATESDWILFVDDDNVVDPEYLERFTAIARGHPQLGIIGAGTLAPEFEEEPVPELRYYCKRLALRTVPRAMWSNVAEETWAPWGAGLLVRRDIAQKYVEVVGACPIRLSLGRTGAGLLSGEDDEFSWIGCGMGYGKGIFPELKITHLIDRKRVQRSYLEKIEEGHAFSVLLMNFIHEEDAGMFSFKKRTARAVKYQVRTSLTLMQALTSGNAAKRRELIAKVRMSAARHRGERKAEAYLREAGKIAG